MPILRALAAAAALMAVAAHAPSAHANEPAAHCVVETKRAQDSDALRVTSETCFRDFAEVLKRVGAPAEMIGRVRHPGQLTAADMDKIGPPGQQVTTSSTFVIGIHYDGRYQTGASFSVVGSNCAGGYLNVSWSWNNRISSTTNGCPSILHFDGANLVGSYEVTYSPGGTLTFMDNRTTSIQYR